MRPKVCLIAIDGVVAEIALQGRGMPQLAHLAATGRRHEMNIATPTISGPSWSTLLTGARYDEHGVCDNNFVGQRLASHPDLLSRAFYADQGTRTFAAAAWPPLVDPRGLGPVIHERREQQAAGLHRVVVRDGETYGYLQCDAEVMAHSRYMLRNDTADVSFIYFCSADEAAHLFGARSREYDAALLRLDGYIGELAAGIRHRVETLGEDWLLVVTTDHGHRDEGGHGGGSAAETQSFVVSHRFGARDVAWPAHIEPTALTPLILAHLAAG